MPHNAIAPLHSAVIHRQVGALRGAGRRPAEPGQPKRSPVRQHRLSLSSLPCGGPLRDVPVGIANARASSSSLETGGSGPEGRGGEEAGDTIRRAGEEVSTSEAAEDWESNSGEAGHDEESELEEGARVVDGVLIPARYAHLPVKEALRRMRIGAGNTGLVPWNKGMKLSTDMLEKIKLKTLEAMQRPEVKAKIAGRKRKPHTAEAREKIRAAMKAHHVKMRKELGIEMTVRERAKLKRQERRQRQRELAEQKAAKRAGEPRSRGTKKRQKRSEAHRRKISEAIRRKWQEPTYRDQMIQSIQAGQEKRLETAKVNAPIRERVKGMMQQAQDELELERKRKFKEVSGIVSKLELEINSLEAQRFIHSAEKDMETVAEIDKVLEEARGVLQQVKGLLEPLTQKMGSVAADSEGDSTNGNGFAYNGTADSSATDDLNNSVRFRKLL